jgi:RimJ/RimL family protein N-acetyltransferase
VSSPPERQNPYGQPIGAAQPDFRPRPLPPATPMDGRYVRLEPLALAHAEDLYEAFALAPDGRAFTYLFDERPTSLDEMRERITRMSASADPRHHAVIDRQSGRAVGHAALMRIDPTHGVIEIGHITMSPLLQRTRMATEMLALFMTRVFDELGYRRFEWKCDSLNAPSRRAAERYGFTYEGLFRQAVVYKARNRDTTWYSIIDSEWPVLREGYAAWLSPDNFDDEGRQRRRLGECLAAARG